MKPFLKWPGGKFRLVERIRTLLGPGRRLVEPFLGSGAVFLNTDYDRYLLGDSNGDLIDLFHRVAADGAAFIATGRELFTGAMNHANKYYALREEFNRTRPSRRRAAIFLYLNRHCYNGLCRYNGSGKFNAPFGRYLRPYFPEKELRGFMEKSRSARLVHAGFEETLGEARRGDVVYCDPPYTPLSSTSHFTDYHTGGFGWSDQERLAHLAQKLAARGIPVVISNHDTVATRVLYSALGAKLTGFKVRRSISCNAKRRNRVGELLAVFG